MVCNCLILSCWSLRIIGLSPRCNKTGPQLGRSPHKDMPLKWGDGGGQWAFSEFLAQLWPLWGCKKRKTCGNLGWRWWRPMSGSRPQPEWPMSGIHDRSLRWLMEGPPLLHGTPWSGSEHAGGLPDIAPQREPETQGHGLPHLCLRSSPFPGKMVTMLYTVALMWICFWPAIKMSKGHLDHYPAQDHDTSLDHYCACGTV